jgi:hypothetical protein
MLPELLGVRVHASPRRRRGRHNARLSTSWQDLISHLLRGISCCAGNPKENRTCLQKTDRGSPVEPHFRSWPARYRPSCWQRQALKVRLLEWNATNIGAMFARSDAKTAAM